MLGLNEIKSAGEICDAPRVTIAREDGKIEALFVDHETTNGAPMIGAFGVG